MFFLIIVDSYVYDVEFMAFIGDFILLWMNFVNYMSLNKILIAVQSICMGMFSVIALTHFQRVFLQGELDWLVVFFYIF